MSGKTEKPARRPAPSRAFLALAVACLAAGTVGAEEFGEPIVLRSLNPEIDRQFGASVAVSGNALAVGVPYSPEGGVVYVYERDGAGGWRLMEIVSGVNPSSREEFGASVSLGDETLVVGAPDEDSRELDAGAAYVFYRNRGGASNWGRARTLVPRNLEEYGNMGRSVTISGDRIAAGSPGAECVFVHQRNNPIRSWWGIQAQIDNPNEGYSAGYTFGFGDEVAMAGKTLAVVGSEDRKYSPSASELFLFDLLEDGNGSESWQQVGHKATDWPSSGEWEDDWASRLDLDAGLLITGGAYRPTCAGRIFERNRGGRNRWGLRTRLQDPSVDLHETSDVALRGNTAAVAAQFRVPDIAAYGHGALVFERHLNGRDRWAPSARLFSPDFAEPARSVAVGPREIVLGHPGAGVVQVFPRAPLVAADFEAGDTAGLSWATGNVAVISPGLSETEYALEVSVDGTTKKSMVRARHPHREPVVSLGFDLAIHRVGLAAGRVEIMNLYGPTRDLVRLTLEEDPNVDQYWLRLLAWEEGGRGFREVGETRMPPMRSQRIELDWRAASGPGHDNGRVRLIVDGKVKLQAHDLDTDRQLINGLLLGLPEGSKGTAGGAFLLDEIVLNR